MIKKLLYFATILLSLFNVNGRRYITKSYIDNNSDIYTIQNYCIENYSVNDNCYTISKSNLNDIEITKQETYYNLNKHKIKNDFNNINLNKLLSNNN